MIDLLRLLELLLQELLHFLRVHFPYHVCIGSQRYRYILEFKLPEYCENLLWELWAMHLAHLQKLHFIPVWVLVPIIIIGSFFAEINLILAYSLQHRRICLDQVLELRFVHQLKRLHSSS